MNLPTQNNWVPQCGQSGRTLAHPEVVMSMEAGGAGEAVEGGGTAAIENSFGGGTVWTHFTNAEGVEGITGVQASSLAPGETATVSQLNFGTGANPYLANAPGDIFVTDLPATAPSSR